MNLCFSSATETPTSFKTTFLASEDERDGLDKEMEIRERKQKTFKKKKTTEVYFILNGLSRSCWITCEIVMSGFGGVS
jgi:hypothetical protein